MVDKSKYRIQEKKGDGYRLTLSAAAFAQAVLKSKPISGYVAFPRVDGQWDVMVSTATADLLKQERGKGEHLSDVVVRMLADKTV